MAFKFSDRERTIRVYNLRADTREFIGSCNAYIPPGMGLPANCTNIAPLEPPAGKVAIFDGTRWGLAEDHRNETLYSKQTGKQVIITELGALSSDVTTVAPEGDYIRWNDKGWVKDTKAENAAAIAYAEGEKKRLIQNATLMISTLQDAADLNMAMDNEITLLSEWKKYRVLLNRVKPDAPLDIIWPKQPE